MSFMFYQAAEMRCYGSKSTQTHVWSDTDLVVTSTFQDPTGVLPAASVAITIACNESVYGNANFSLTGINSGSPAAIVLQGAHRCACHETYANDVYCSQQGVVPQDQLNDISNKLSKATTRCGNSNESTLLYMLPAALIILVLTFASDVAVACLQPRTGLEGNSWLNCMCCSMCNALSAPEACMQPSDKVTKPLLIIMGSIAGTVHHT